MAAVDRVAALHDAIAALAQEDPNGWPETVVSVCAGVAGLDLPTLDLLVDAATMSAATAHAMALEAREEESQVQPELGTGEETGSDGHQN